MQVKLLRVIQEQEVRRIGGIKPIKVDVRFIASTNQSLQKLVELGKFRKDLFFRLNVINISVPPLRESPHRYPGPCRFLFEAFCHKYDLNKKCPLIS
jgi:transcriptional regulator of aroF, aroG, tyrA and aromatic amino acid transport